MTALHWIAKRNYTELIRPLISYGAQINAKDVLGRTPIYIAAKFNHLESVNELLALKADPFIKCRKKLTAEDVTSYEELRTIIKKSKLFSITRTWGGTAKGVNKKR